MTWFVDFYRSAIGKKAVMASTGIVLFGFVVGHMAGNLKLYLGAEAINHYGEWLRELGTPALPPSGALWIARIVLLASVVLHIHSATMLTLMNRRAKPIDSAQIDLQNASYASRTMRWGGVIVLMFIVYHLLDLTFGVTNPAFKQGEVYANIVASFSRWWIAGFYIVANFALGFHLHHGLWSMFQSLGWNHPKFNKWRREFATAFAVFITVGNISFPLSVLLGVVK